MNVIVNWEYSVPLQHILYFVHLHQPYCAVYTFESCAQHTKSKWSFVCLYSTLTTTPFFSLFLHTLLRTLALARLIWSESCWLTPHAYHRPWRVRTCINRTLPIVSPFPLPSCSTPPPTRATFCRRLPSTLTASPWTEKIATCPYHAAQYASRLHSYLLWRKWWDRETRCKRCVAVGGEELLGVIKIWKFTEAGNGEMHWIQSASVVWQNLQWGWCNYSFKVLRVVSGSEILIKIFDCFILPLLFVADILLIGIHYYYIRNVINWTGGERHNLKIA